MTAVEHMARQKERTQYLAVYLNRIFHALSIHANFIA